MALKTAGSFELFRENQQTIASENIAAPATLATMVVAIPPGEIPSNNEITNEGTANRANPNEPSNNTVTVKKDFELSIIFCAILEKGLCLFCELDLPKLTEYYFRSFQ